MKSRSMLVSLAAAVIIVSCTGQAVAPPGGDGSNRVGGAVPSEGEAYLTAIEDLDLELAIEMYEKIATDGSEEQRAVAQLVLAWFDYRVRNDPDGARVGLARIASENPGWAEPTLVLSKIETLLGNFAAAQEAASRATEIATTPSEVRDGQLLFALATVKEAIAARLGSFGTTAGGAIALEETGGASAAQLEESLITLRTAVTAEPGELRSSRLLLAAALLLDDGDSALLAYRSYYWLYAGQQPDSMLAGPYATLEEILPRWQGPDSPAEDRERLIEALVGSRFFHEAAIVALDPRLGQEPSVEDRQVIAYVHFLDNLEAAMDEYYRNVVTGQASSTAQRVFEREFERFCDIVCTSGSRGEALQIARDRFGMRYHFRNGRRDLLMGHAIVEDRRTLEQYGQELTFYYRRLDSLVSHGVRSWLFDRLYFVGGWADQTQIVTYRPFRVQLLLDLARPALDPRAREDFEESIVRNSENDERIAAENPYAGLPGLRGRLILRSLDSIWAQVQEPGISDVQQRMRFLALLDEVWMEGPAFAHEGRHVIDIGAGITDSVELEFRAKLAEIAFCRYPGIPLGHNVLHPGIGISGHGDANLRIVQGLVAWMEDHADEINGLDPSRPLLPQLDLLTDDQLRAAARDLDPMANEVQY